MEHDLQELIGEGLAQKWLSPRTQTKRNDRVVNLTWRLNTSSERKSDES